MLFYVFHILLYSRIWSIERTLILLNGKKEGESRECSVYNVIQMAAISVAILGFTQIKVTRAQAFRTRKKWLCKIEKKVGLLI